MGKRFLDTDKQAELGIMSPEVKARLAQAHSVLEGNGDLAEADDAPASPPGQTARSTRWEDAIECAKCGGSHGEDGMLLHPAATARPDAALLA